MEKGIQNINSFHLAGIIPIAGQKLDFNFPWHDSLQPIAQDYLAIERAVWECACAGCETIWIVCHNDMQPLIRYRLGDYVQDPLWMNKNRLRMPEEVEIPTPIYYVPIHPKDRDKRDCLGWSALYGALTSYWLSRTISKWVIPDKYYVAFPYGVYNPELVKPHRKKISSKKPFYISYENKTIKDNEYLGFTFDSDDFKSCRSIIRTEGTGMYKEYNGDKLSIEERWSARYFSLDKIFKPVNIEDGNELEIPWYFKIDNWSSYCDFLGDDHRKELVRPSRKELGYHEWNPIGEENDEQ